MCGAPCCYDTSRDDSGAVDFFVYPRNPVTLSAMDVKNRSSPVDSTWKYAVRFDMYEVKRRNCECH